MQEDVETTLDGGQEPDGATDEATDVVAEEEPDSGDRSRSTISFPYTGLADAEEIARELHGFGGGAAPEGIAEARGQKARSGAFRQKLSAARIFGLVTTSPGRVTLTKLGNSIIDPDQRDAARVEAFLHVPLYKAVFDQYDGNLLPPPSALERRMVELGVSPKQATVARQVFHRSAELAGFFRRGANKLTLPDVTSQTETRKNGGASSTGGAEEAMTDALQALWFTLLREGESWSTEKTREYLDGARRVYSALRQDK